MEWARVGYVVSPPFGGTAPNAESDAAVPGPFYGMV